MLRYHVRPHFSLGQPEKVHSTSSRSQVPRIVKWTVVIVSANGAVLVCQVNTLPGKKKVDSSQQLMLE